MPTFEFRVLCSSQNACNLVMETMNRSFTHVTPTRKSPTSDHTAEKVLDDMDVASDLARQLLQEYDGRIRKVTVVAK